MLQDGDLDAIYSARNPGPFNQPGHGGIRRLFAEPSAVERAYARDENLPDHPWIAQELFRACSLSKDLAAGQLPETAALSCMLPWAAEHDQQTRDVLGDDWWPYGTRANHDTLRTFLRYSHEQGLADSLLEPEELFAPETLEHFVI